MRPFSINVNLKAMRTLPFLALFIMAGPSLADTHTTATLSLYQALEWAQERSAALPAQKAAAMAAHEMAVVAKSLPDPTLSLAINNLSIEGPSRFSFTGNPMTMRAIGLSQSFPDEAKRQAQSERYLRIADAANTRYVLQGTELRRQTAMAWLTRYYQERLIATITQQRDIASQITTATTSAYGSGRASQSEVLMAHTAVARIDDRLQTANAELEVAQSLLLRWLGDAADRALSAPPPIAHSRVDTLAQSGELDREVLKHPEIALLNANEQIALAELSTAKAEKNTDWSMFISYGKRDPLVGDVISLGVSIPLQWDRANRQDRSVSAKENQAEQVRLEREELIREHRYAITRLLTNWRSLLARLKDYEKTILPLAKERSQSVEAAFRGNKATLAAVLAAKQQELDIELETINMSKQTALAWGALEFWLPPPAMQQTDEFATPSRSAINAATH